MRLRLSESITVSRMAAASAGGGATGRKGIRECPIFYPTEEEFGNFEQFVLSIEVTLRVHNSAHNAVWNGAMSVMDCS